MPNLKDKLSDSELNKSQKDFDDIVSQPGMRALDDQGDAIARHLEGKEKEPSSPSGVDGLRSLREAENNSATTSNPMGYQKTDKKPSRTPLSGWSGRKKALTAGGAAGGIGGLLIALFMMLPLKIPAIMDSVANEAGQRVEKLTEERAKLILGRAILTKFGTHTGVVLTGEGALKTLFASMRTNGFEKRLADKGLTISTTPDGVKLSYKGTPLGDGTTFKNEKQIIDALEQNRLTNKMLKQVIREDIPSWRWMKRAKFAKWMRIKYGIPRYGIANDTNETDDEERAKKLQESRLKTAYAMVAKNALSAFNCVMGSGCDVTELGGKPDGSKTSQNIDEMANSVNEAAEELATAGASTDENEVTKTLTKSLIDKLGTKAIPVVGWIDLAATIDHIAYNFMDNDYYAKLPAYYRGLQYAQLYGSWAGYSDQQKLGALDNAVAGLLANQLNGSETSRAMNYIDGKPDQGEPIKLRVDSNKPSEISKYWNTYKNTIGSLPVGGLPPGTPVVPTNHEVLNAYYETIGGGGLLGWLSDKLGGVISDLVAALTPAAAEKWVEDILTSGLEKMMDFFGLTIDPKDTGAALANNLHAGATVSYNDYCKEIGCRKLTPAQTVMLNNQIHNERTADIREKGLAYQLFSPENTQSAVSQLAMSLPTVSRVSDIGSIVTYVGKLVTGAPSVIGSMISPSSSASRYVDLYGVDPYGATASDLSSPLSDEVIEGETCPEVAEGEFNGCSIDTEVAAAMLCDFEPESADCGARPDSLGGGGTKLRIASYNIKINSSDAWQKTSSRNMADNNFDVVGMQEAENWATYSGITSKVKAHGYSVYPDINKSDVTRNGAQARVIAYKKDRFTLVKSDEVTFNRMDDPVQPARAPIIWLEDNDTSQQIIVINTHNPAYGYNGGPSSNYNGPKQRHDAAKNYIAKLKELKAENLPIFFVGDFNEGWGVRRDRANLTLDGDYKNLFYCMLRENDNILRHALDVANKTTPPCSSTRPYGPVDHIYVSGSVLVHKYRTLTGSAATLGTDHHIVPYADVEVPGTGSDTVAGNSVRVATFNILHSPDNNWRDRLTRSVKALTDKQIGIAGLQEVRPDQQRLFKQPEYGGNVYDMYPAKVTNGRPADENPDSVVIWDKSMYELVEGRQKSIKYEGGARKVNIVKLRYIKGGARGPEVYVLNTHDPVDNRSEGGSGAQNRKDNNELYYKTIKEELSDAPVIFTGDFNSKMTVEASGNKPLGNKRENLAYCILTRNNLMTHVSDSQQGKTGCPSQKDVLDRNDVDHIFITPELKASGYGVVERGVNGGDHEMVYSDIKIPGLSTSNPSGGWVWPMQSGLKPGPCYAKMVFGRAHAGMDINTDDPDAPALAMRDGTIHKTSSGGADGNSIIVKTPDGYFYWLQHLKSISKFSGPVKAGEKLGVVGKTGNVSASSAGHLHIVIYTKEGDYPSYGSLQSSIDPMSKLPTPAPGGYKCY